MSSGGYNSGPPRGVGGPPIGVSANRGQSGYMSLPSRPMMQQAPPPPMGGMMYGQPPPPPQVPQW
jgi:hypothetical protein